MNQHFENKTELDRSTFSGSVHFPVLKGFLLKFSVLIIAILVWLPCIHFFYQPDIREYHNDNDVPLKARMLAVRHLQIWTDPILQQYELKKMQRLNPEWDFMSRTYFVLAIANMALRNQTYKQQALNIIDKILVNTLRLEREKGLYHFLLGYSRNYPWVIQPPRSQFIDGEIALMLAARRIIEEKPSYKPLLSERVELMTSRMRQSPVMCAESYPDECWMFCNTVSLAAIRMADALDGSDHSVFLSSWIKTAKHKLVEERTGLLISAFGVDGTPAECGFGPEGSTIWMVCKMLQIIDKEFAVDQYRRAKSELACSLLGFGFSREWPETSEGPKDVDSGPVIPVIDASASASGMAFIAAIAFEDMEYFNQLMTSLNFVGFPSKSGEKLSYKASNPVGDSVLLYSLVQGPLWKEVQRRIEQ